MGRELNMKSPGWNVDLILLLILLFSSATSSQTDVSVGATTKWIFGIDENLSLVWKTSNKGFSVACNTNQYFVAINGNDVPAKVFAARIDNGKMAWATSLTGIPMGWGTSADSIGGNYLTLSLYIGDSMRTEVRNLATGKLLETKTTFKKERSKEASVCPLPSPDDTLTFFTTAKHICSISPNLTIIWNHNLKQNEYLASVYKQYGVLSSKKNIRILDRNSGAQLWERSFENEIRGMSIGATLTISFANGKKDSLDIRTGISKTK